MKIMFSDATLLHGGAERVISILANELVKLGHEVEVFLLYDKPIWYELDSRVNVYNDEEAIGKANVLKHIIYRHKVFKKTDADIIISFLAPVNMINIFSSAFCKTKIIVADRNDPNRTPVNLVVRKCRDFLYRFADGIVLQSKNNRSYFSKKVQRKSKVIFNPVDVGVNKRIAFSTIKKDEIVTVGRLIDQKNPFMLLEAFYEFQKKYPTYELTYLGEGNLSARLRQRAYELGISEKVHIPGAVKNVFNRIAQSKVFVMTSQYEGMPNALIEAMCVGVPVISTKVSGAVDLIQDRVNGRLVDCNDVKGLTTILCETIENYEIAEEQAIEASKMNEELATSNIVSEWINYVGEVLEKT